MMFFLYWWNKMFVMTFVHGASNSKAVLLMVN